MIFVYAAGFRTFAGIAFIHTHTMKTTNSVTPIYHEVPHLIPFKLCVFSVSLEDAPADWQRDRMENGFSRFGLDMLVQASHDIGFNHVAFRKEPSGQPVGYLEKGERLEVSVSHSRLRLWSALALHNPLGIDAEPVSRIVSDVLYDRITNREERYHLRIEPIRLWTIKESILKLIGTGLRTNMSSLNVKRITDLMFETSLLGRIVQTISYRVENHWLSISYFK